MSRLTEPGKAHGGDLSEAMDSGSMETCKLRRRRHFLSKNGRSIASVSGSEYLDRERGYRDRYLAGSAMAQDHSYTSKELQWMKRFRYVIVSSKFHQLNNLLHFAHSA